MGHCVQFKTIQVLQKYGRSRSFGVLGSCAAIVSSYIKSISKLTSFVRDPKVWCHFA